MRVAVHGHCLRAVSGGLLACALLWVGVMGCQSSAPPLTTQEIHLKQLSIYYGQYTSANKGAGPKNENDLKAFIKKRATHLTDEQIAAMFVSPRDQKPYVVAYNVRMGPMPAEAPFVAYEQTGVEGKQYAADLLGGVQEVEAAEVQRRALKS